MSDELNTWQMVKVLMENPKRKAKCRGVEVWISEGNYLHWNGQGGLFLGNGYEIIEPPKKLKEMSFGEAVYNWSHNPIDIPFINKRCIISSVSGKSIDRSFIDITKDEYLGLWTIEGVYEDE